MGPLAAQAQVGEVQRAVDAIACDTELVYGEIGLPDVTGADAAQGAFYSHPALCVARTRCIAPRRTTSRAFGPVNYADAVTARWTRPSNSRAADAARSWVRCSRR